MLMALAMLMSCRVGELNSQKDDDPGCHVSALCNGDNRSYVRSSQVG